MNRRTRISPCVLYPVALAIIAAPIIGCATGARVQLSAAESLELLTRSVEQAVDEYHGDIRAADANRRTGVIEAFVQRIRTDHESDERVGRHAARFTEALDKLQGDAEVAGARKSATLDNLRSIREVAAGLRSLGVQSMSLDDEVRRYVTDLLTRNQNSQSVNATGR